MDDRKSFGANKDSWSKKLGDKIERAGDKVTDAGAPKTGNAIRNAGDKIEHMNDKKNPNPKY
jgi:hypothetical protein